jgi:hypothetical protein
MLTELQLDWLAEQAGWTRGPGGYWFMPDGFGTSAQHAVTQE